MTTPTDSLGRSTAVQSSPSRTATDPVGGFLSALAKLGPADHAAAKTQAEKGGEVSRSDPKLWNAYQGYLRTVPLKDSPELRQEFLRQVGAREEFNREKKIDKPTPLTEATFRASHAIDTLNQREDKTLRAADGWMLPALANPKLAFDPQSMAVMRGVSVEGSKAANLAELVRGRTNASAETKAPASKNTLRQPARPASTFERTPKAPPATQSQPVAPVEDDEVIVVNSAENVAQSPVDARASQRATVSKDAREVSELEKRAKVATTGLIDGRTSLGMRQAYSEFIDGKGVKDSLATQKEFVSLLSLRSSYMDRKGVKGAFTAADERAFLADTALSRLRMRQQTKQPLAPREGEAWMIRALTDPAARLSDSDLKLLGDVTWTNQGLRTSLAELRANEIKRAEATPKPLPGEAYSAQISADSIFGGGDVQSNAFTLAARVGGYDDEEIGRAKQYMQDNGMKLFVNYTNEGEKEIRSLSDATVSTSGGQSFIQYDMSDKASKILLDARYAGPGQSVADYRAQAQNSWSGTMQQFGDQVLAYAQTKSRELGLEENATLGPLVRGSYDAIREVTLIGANAGQNAEMIYTTAKKAVETGNLLYNIKGDAEQTRKFDNIKANALAAAERSAKTYPAEETSEVAKFARGLIGSGPKMVMTVVPGSFLIYNALKHTNDSNMNDFAKDTLLDIAGLMTGPASAQLTNGVKNVAARTLPSALLDDVVANRVIREVSERGSSAVVGAVSNVATDTLPAAIQQSLGNLTPEEAQKRLTFTAFARNVGTGITMGLLSPQRGDRDADVLARKDTDLMGHLYSVTQPDGETKYYSPARVTDSKGKQHIEFLEVIAADPKVREKLNNKEVTRSTQGEVERSLMQSRWDQMTPAQREQLKAAANRFAEKQTLLDAERGVVTLSSKSKPALALPAAKVTDSTPTVSAKKVEVSPTKAKVEVPTPKKAETPAAPAALKPAPVDAGIAPERLTRAEEKLREAEKVYRTSDADDPEAVMNQALMDMAGDIDASPEVRQKLETLKKNDDWALRKLLMPGKDDVAPMLQALASKDPAVNARVKEVLNNVGNGSLDPTDARVQLKEATQKRDSSSTPVVVSAADTRLQALLAASPPPKTAASSTTPLARGDVDLSTYRTDAATRARIREMLPESAAKDLGAAVSNLKDLYPEYKGIPDEDLMALRAYSSSIAKVNYEGTNAALRTQGREELKRLAPLIEGASSALNQMPPVEGTVYRGVRSDKMPPEVLARYMPGQTVTELSFTSTSKSEDFARSLDKPDVIMVIQSRGKGRDMANSSKSVNEKEVLFTPGTNFRVLARETEPTTGKTIIYMDQLP